MVWGLGFWVHFGFNRVQGWSRASQGLGWQTFFLGAGVFAYKGFL